MIKPTNKNKMCGLQATQAGGHVSARPAGSLVGRRIAWAGLLENGSGATKPASPKAKAVAAIRPIGPAALPMQRAEDPTS